MGYRTFLLLITLGLAGVVPARAAPQLPEAGTRIRITARMPEHRRWAGPFVSVLGDTVTMRDGDLNGDLVAVPTLHVERFEISRGVHPNIGRGAIVGFAMGAALGATVGYLAYRDSDVGPGAGVVLGASLLGGLGALINISNEFRSPSEQWRRLEPRDLGGRP